MPAFHLSVRITLTASYTHLRGEQGTEPVPLEPHRLMTNANGILGQQVLDLAQR